MLGRLLIASALLMACGAFAQPIGTVIENELLTVKYISPGGYFSLISRPSQRAFVSHGSFDHGTGVATATNITDRIFGKGQAIEIAYPDGNKDSILVFPKLPFAVFRSSLHNGGADVSVVQKFTALSAVVNLGKPASALNTLGTGGLLAADKNPGSYAWLAVAEPESRNGVVFGWLTQDRGSGVLFSDVKQVVFRGEDDGPPAAVPLHVGVRAQIDYGRLRIAPGKTQELETLAIGYFDDARLGLETWADAIAKVYDIHLKPQPTGYCTWYSQPHGGAADEQHLAELAAYSATNLAPFGFSVVQIDDKWQAGFKRSSPSSPKKDFRTHDPDGPYPKGMQAAANHVKSLGLVPGIWFMPFAGTVGDPFFDQHLDWFAKTPDGKPYDTPWGGACLDLSNPGARAHVRDITGRICREWGFRYLKIDGLWTGTATKQLYVNSGYKEDDLGEAVFSNPDKTGIEVFRDGLKLVREAAGPDVFILGCNAPQNMRTYGGAFGLVDAMRVGPDNKADWKSLLRGPTFGTRHYFLHRRVWFNDPDPVYVRESIPLNHAQLICSWVALSGQLNLSSEWLPGLPPERLNILKRTMPTHNAVARPVDLFENDLPRIWTVSAPDRDVIGLFNWDGAEQRFDVPLERLGLNATAEYAAFDFWGDQLLPSVKGRLQLTVPGQSCVVLAVRPTANHPQLISTSRHVLQGIVDTADVRWDGKSRVLSGRSRLIAKDPCELRILTSGAASVIKVEVPAGVIASNESPASDKPPKSLARVKLTSPTTREVAWTLHFQ
jgi:Alpha galactosidase C-terminal beta sandwich domain